MLESGCGSRPKRSRGGELGWWSIGDLDVSRSGLGAGAGAGDLVWSSAASE